MGSSRGEYNKFLVLLLYSIQSNSRPARTCMPFDIDNPMHMHVGCLCVYDASFSFVYVYVHVVYCCCCVSTSIDTFFLFFFSRNLADMFASLYGKRYTRTIGMQKMHHTQQQARTLLTSKGNNALLIHFISFVHLRQFVHRLQLKILLHLLVDLDPSTTTASSTSSATITSMKKAQAHKHLLNRHLLVFTTNRPRWSCLIPSPSVRSFPSSTRCFVYIFPFNNNCIVDLWVSRVEEKMPSKEKKLWSDNRNEMKLNENNTSRLSNSNSFTNSFSCSVCTKCLLFIFFCGVVLVSVTIHNGNPNRHPRLNQPFIQSARH